MRRPVVVVAVLCALAAVAAGHCPNYCSGHGDCSFDREMVCTCFSGWTGYDCSQRLCATGFSWTGFAETTDGLHTQVSECSNMGDCNRATGECTCQENFEGLACNKLSCPNDCNGHGRCMSMGDAASTVDGFRLLTDTTYSNWDAEMVFGCVCDLGFFGYDCSLRTCPTGDDPLTFGQADEEQVLDCTCDTCSGYFVLTFRGSTTSRIAHNAVMTIADEDPDVRTTGIGAGESLEAKLQALRTVTGVTVTSTDASVCSSGGTTTTITFTQNGGDVPELEVSSFLSGSATPTLAISHGGTGASFDGTTEDAVCSNRGICDESRGICTCFENFEASDGESSQGDIPDCGAQTPLSLITDCPNACSGNGECDTGTYTCACHQGFTGADCSLRECPFGPAWFDEAYDTDQAHQLARCSNMGRCDFSTGLCSCQSGFTGGACNRLECPSSTGTRPCNSRGLCLSNKELARLGTTNGEFNGVLEVQEVSCAATSGTFTVAFRHSITDNIPFDATAADVQTALEALPTLGLVTVNFVSPATVACSAAPNVFRVTFERDFGDLPDLEVATSTAEAISATPVQAGTRVTYGETEGVANTWDADMIHGCLCDGYPAYNRTTTTGDFGYYSDYACTSRMCPFGHDVLTLETTAVPTVMTVSCLLAAGTFTLEFRTQVTAPIPFDAVADDIDAALEALDSVGLVTVALTGTAPQACDSGGLASFTVQFDTELGTLPLLIAEPDTHDSADITVTATQATDTVSTECARRGICDRSLGVCKCFSGHVSGNGFGGKGGRGDCGAQDPLFVAS